MIEPFKKTIDGVYHIDSWEKKAPGLVAGFTSKNGGTGKYSGLNMAFHVNDEKSSVQQNRQHVSEIIGFPIKNWVGCEQTHETHIASVSKSSRGCGALDYESALSSTDGLYTNETGVLLTLCYADCVPLYFFDRTTKKIGSAHAGWKGSVGGIGPKMVLQWEKEGSSLRDIEVVIGPSICKDCYQVGNSVITEAEKWYDAQDEKAFNSVLNKPDTYYFSLQMFNKDILVKTGIPLENIQVTQLCSSCSPDFFSHRRDQGFTGRMMSFIGWKGRE